MIWPVKSGTAYTIDVLRGVAHKSLETTPFRLSFSIGLIVGSILLLANLDKIGMTGSSGKLILTINSGSSSLKIALYRIDYDESLILSGAAVRLGSPGCRIRMADAKGQVLVDREIGLADHVAAFHQMAEWLDQRYSQDGLSAVGHRLVHGGRHFTEPQIIDQQLLRALQDLVPIDPDHTPQAIKIIGVVAAHYPSVPQVACFDTAFHRHLPRFAEMYALPRHFYDEGVLRYGFHGLSYEYICGELARIDSPSDGGQASSFPPKSAPESPASPFRRSAHPSGSRVIVAHLGNGASMAAILNGKSIDTSMGFTPVSGLVMGSRCGDVDAGAIVHLIEEKKMTPQEVNTLINKQSGLLGVSGTSEDMQDLLNREMSDPGAADAIQLFCYSAKKYIGAFAVALGGLDSVVFTGGIGENAPTIRERICSGLDFLGIEIDDARNNGNAPLISADDSRVKVHVIKTDEDLMIARHTARLIDTL